MPNFPLVDPFANEDGPNISGEQGNERVQYRVKRVKHHVPCELPAIYFQFSTDDVVESFRINARLLAANIPAPKTAVLHVEVTLAEPGDPPVPPEPDEAPGG
jgi:hypothetical protein